MKNYIASIVRDTERKRRTCLPHKCVIGIVIAIVIAIATDILPAEPLD